MYSNHPYKRRLQIICFNQPSSSLITETALQPGFKVHAFLRATNCNSLVSILKRIISLPEQIPGVEAHFLISPLYFLISPLHFLISPLHFPFIPTASMPPTSGFFDLPTAPIPTTSVSAALDHSAGVSGVSSGLTDPAGASAFGSSRLPESGADSPRTRLQSAFEMLRVSSRWSRRNGFSGIVVRLEGRIVMWRSKMSSWQVNKGEENMRNRKEGS